MTRKIPSVNPAIDTINQILETPDILTRISLEKEELSNFNQFYERHALAKTHSMQHIFLDLIQENIRDVKNNLSNYLSKKDRNFNLAETLITRLHDRIKVNLKEITKADIICKILENRPTRVEDNSLRIFVPQSIADYQLTEDDKSCYRDIVKTLFSTSDIDSLSKEIKERIDYMESLIVENYHNVFLKGKIREISDSTLLNIISIHTHREMLDNLDGESGMLPNLAESKNKEIEELKDKAISINPQTNSSLKTRIKDKITDLREILNTMSDAMPIEKQIEDVVRIIYREGRKIKDRLNRNKTISVSSTEFSKHDYAFPKLQYDLNIVSETLNKNYMDSGVRKINASIVKQEIYRIEGNIKTSIQQKKEQVSSVYSKVCDCFESAWIREMYNAMLDNILQDSDMVNLLDQTSDITGNHKENIIASIRNAEISFVFNNGGYQRIIINNLEQFYRGNLEDLLLDKLNNRLGAVLNCLEKIESGQTLYLTYESYCFNTLRNLLFKRKAKNEEIDKFFTDKSLRVANYVTNKRKEIVGVIADLNESLLLQVPPNSLIGSEPLDVLNDMLSSLSEHIDIDIEDCSGLKSFEESSREHIKIARDSNRSTDLSCAVENPRCSRVSGRQARSTRLKRDVKVKFAKLFAALSGLAIIITLAVTGYFYIALAVFSLAFMICVIGVGAAKLLKRDKKRENNSVGLGQIDLHKENRKDRKEQILLDSSIRTETALPHEVIDNEIVIPPTLNTGSKNTNKAQDGSLQANATDRSQHQTERRNTLS